ncbi:MAG: hypothetical protein FJW24_01260 [Acidimicrobiia bacterium]|nr:hypothetical protein [Acidimicrobiia bacterium]
MSVVGDSIHLCPLCGSDKLNASRGDEVACGGCGSTFSVVPDPRLATLNLTVKKTSLKGWQPGATLLSVPNMDIVHKAATAAKTHHA